MNTWARPPFLDTSRYMQLSKPKLNMSHDGSDALKREGSSIANISRLLIFEELVQTRINILGGWNWKDWLMRYEGSEKQKNLSHPLVLPKSEGVLGIFYIILIPCFCLLWKYLHLIRVVHWLILIINYKPLQNTT